MVHFFPHPKHNSFQLKKVQIWKKRKIKIFHILKLIFRILINEICLSFFSYYPNSFGEASVKKLDFVEKCHKMDGSVYEIVSFFATKYCDFCNKKVRVCCDF